MKPRPSISTFKLHVASWPVLAGIVCCTIWGNSFADSTKDDYNLQEQCGKIAAENFFQRKKEFEAKYAGYVQTNISYTNHYSKRFNKCFYLEFSSADSANDFVVFRNLLDANENKQYGYQTIDEYHTTTTTSCWVLKEKCDTFPILSYCLGSSRMLQKECPGQQSEWDNLIKPYMEE